MDATTQTKPRLFRSGRAIPIDLLIADPSITIIEAGPSVGFLLAESCFDNALGHFFLEQVSWIRRGAGPRHTVRGLGQVALYRHSSGF